MIKTKNEIEKSQIKPFQMCKDSGPLHTKKGEIVHYNAEADRQIRIPIGDINKLRNRIKG